MLKLRIWHLHGEFWFVQLQQLLGGNGLNNYGNVLCELPPWDE